MATFFSRFNPIPSFFNFTGPHKVGTISVEIPVTELSSPAPSPDPTISTICFRIFYPCRPPTKAQKPIYWLPEPQRDYFAAYLNFIGANSRLSGFLQYLPFFNIIARITIPAASGAELLSPRTESKRWPVMVFSHGLGGSKNAYSQILGNLASYGMVVIAPDHRDGSAPISFIESFDGLDRKAVEYISIPHRKGQDVEDGRNAQLRIRLWELGLIHEALLRIDHGNLFRHRIAQQEKTSLQGTELATFTDSLDVHTPGRVSWSGHSFGAATMVQFLKSVYYSGAPVPSSYHALYSPSRPSSINSQITAMSPLCLFDLWALPLRSVATEWLWQQPLPCYASSGKGGSNLLAILSEAFYKWRANLSMTKNIIFPQINGRPSVATGLEPPHVFYAIASTHMGQSDFGVLFPWLTRRVSKSTDPIRDLRLNIRATLELMRRNGLDIADTSFLDADIISKNQCTSSPLNEKRQNRKGQKSEILATDNSIESWMAVAANDIMDQKTGEATNTNLGENATPAEAIIEGEILDNEKPAGKL